MHRAEKHSRFTLWKIRTLSNFQDLSYTTCSHEDLKIGQTTQTPHKRLNHSTPFTHIGEKYKRTERQRGKDDLNSRGRKRERGRSWESWRMKIQIQTIWNEERKGERFFTCGFTFRVLFICWFTFSDHIPTMTLVSHRLKWLILGLDFYFFPLSQMRKRNIFIPVLPNALVSRFCMLMCFMQTANILVIDSMGCVFLYFPLTWHILRDDHKLWILKLIHFNGFQLIWCLFPLSRCNGIVHI